MMKRWIGTLLFAFFLSAVVVFPGFAQQGTLPGGRDPVFEQKVYDRLAQVDPAAVAVFKDATEKLDQGDLVAARDGFEAVLSLVPDSSDALRRLSYIYLEWEDSQEAERLALRALSLMDSPENKVALADVLLFINSPRSNFEALKLAQEAVESEPEDINNLSVLMFAGAAVNDNEAVRRASAEIIRIYPDDPEAHLFAGFAAAVDKEWEQAEKELLLSRRLGAPPEVIEQLLEEGIRTQARIHRWLRRGGYFLVIWAFSLGLLFMVGLVLSKMTLAAVNHKKGFTGVEISPGERRARRIYRFIIAVTSIYFYLSIPVLLVSVVAPVGVFFYMFLQSGTIPIKAAFFILMVAVYTLYAVVRSLFKRRKGGEPGLDVSRADAYYLWQVVVEVARHLGTRPVDKIYATPGTEIAVFERGSLWRKLRGQGERCLVLGFGALPGMTQGQFQAILAHEYGHFNNADTAGGDLAGRVGFTIHNMALGLLQVGTATWYNPAWLFINGYYRIFLRVTQGASRLQEILADRYAAMNYGVANCKSGLEYITRQNLVFNYCLKGEVEEARVENRDLKNLYSLPAVENNVDIDTSYAQIIERPSSPYDSHPSLKERLAYLDLVKNPGPDQLDTRPVWDLFGCAETLQEEMTHVVEQNLRLRNILPPAASD